MEEKFIDLGRIIYIVRIIVIFLNICRYYLLEVVYFKLVLDRKFFEMLWNKYWVNILLFLSLFTVSG